MADFLALDLEHQQLCGLDAQVTRGTVRVRKCFQLAWPEDLSLTEQPRQVGEWLKAELARLGIGGRQTLVALAREDAVVRQLELPNAPDEELPDLVRFQAATKSTLPLDQLLLDFVPLPPRAGMDGREVLMTTISTQFAGRIRTLVEAAGLELASISITPFAMAELVARVERRRGDDPNDLSLIVARHAQRVEISMMLHQHLLFTHSAQLHEVDEQGNNRALLAEVSRAQYSLNQMLPDVAVARVWVLGSESENRALCVALRERLDRDVATLDPLSDVGAEVDTAADVPGNLALYAGPMGVLYAYQASSIPTVNFLNPRKPPVKVDRRKQRLALAAAGIMLIAAAGYGSLQMHLSDLDASIKSKRDEHRQLQAEVKKGQPDLKAAELIDDWSTHNVNWLDQLQQLNKTLPGTERIYLTAYRFDPASGDAIARIRGDAYARQRFDIQTLSQRLADENYRVQPQEDRLSRADSGYPRRFSLDLRLVPPAGDAPQSKDKQ